MTWIYDITGNYAVSVILLTILVRGLLIPMYVKQLDTTAKMSELQVQAEEIKQRYARDQQKMNEKLNELYQQNGVNTYAGCLPLLIQLPVMMGLYELLRSPVVYMNSASMLAAVHESFLWIPDLSQPDAWILPILAGITTYLTTYASTKGQDPNAAGAMKGMNYFMPLMIFLLGRSFAASLALYWVVGNVIMIIQTLIMNRIRDKKKLKKEAQAEIEKRKKQEKANN